MKPIAGAAKYHAGKPGKTRAGSKFGKVDVLDFSLWFFLVIFCGS